jgi:hypothetical protein
VLASCRANHRTTEARMKVCIPEPVREQHEVYTFEISTNLGGTYQNETYPTLGMETQSARMNE